MKSKWFLFYCFLFAISSSLSANTLPAPIRLRVDLLLLNREANNERYKISSKEFGDRNLALSNTVSPEVISRKRPLFSWEVDTAIKKVTAFRILLASSKELLVKDQADYWDSKQTSGITNQVYYAGKPMQPGGIYYWKVQVWNQSQQKTLFSGIAEFVLEENLNGDSISHHSLSFDWQLPEKTIQKSNGDVFFDFGKDAFAQLRFHFTSEKEDSLVIEAGETMNIDNTVSKNQSGNIRYSKIKLAVKKGENDCLLKWPVDKKRNSRNPIQMPDDIGEVFPFRYVSSHNFSGRMEKGSVIRKMVHYPFDDAASSFSSDNTILNQVWELCKYSVKATSFTGFYVDGDRERLPYEADALINQLSHYGSDAEYSMARRTMAYLIYHPTWPTEWSLQNVMLAWNDYMYTGDDSFIKRYYTELQKKILVPLAGNNGLISTRTDKQSVDFLQSIHILKDFDGKHGLKDNVDWPQNGNYKGEKEYYGETDGFVYTTYNAVINAYYYENLILMGKIADVLHKNVDAAMYAAKAKQVWNAYQQVFVDPVNGLVKDGDQTNHSSLHSNMFALLFGLVSERNRKQVIIYIKTRKMACSVYGAQFLLEALYNNGEAQYAQNLLTDTTGRSWYNMIRIGSTITMEAWDKLYKPNLDWNHAWGSAPANIIVRKMMGVEPLMPGFSIISIKPQLGNLSYAKLHTTTLKGEVSVTYQKIGKEGHWQISVPGASTANIYLPFHAGENELVMDRKKMLVNQVNGCWIIKGVESGSHQIIVSSKSIN